ncbi:uncharacterized protein [Pempheris klunzingeri]|uniref:uncharacterized protein n=1 Tax=Pempheris klunzingeri TaxID=3127111 RepID=UPI00398073B1
MSACCVSGCKNRHSSSSKLKFYRIPSDYRPFQANRRRLWLRAIRQVNGSTEELRGNARVCSAHFISGEASMDHDSPDFVPSVFNVTSTKQSPSPKKRVKGLFGHRKKRRRTAKPEPEEHANPPRVDFPVALQPLILLKDIQISSTPTAEERGKLTKGTKTETKTKTLKLQTTSSPNKAPPVSKALADFLKVDNRIPIVLLKHVFKPAGGYQCELCNQNFTTVSQLVKHRQLHEEEERSFLCETCGKHFSHQADVTEHQCVHELSFPCNICDRSFTTSHNLKRHKLLHVKDGRKCPKCGVLFCQRHNHVLFLPQTESVIESEQDSSIIEPETIGSKVVPENDLLDKPEPIHTADLEDDAQSTMTVTPLPTTTAQTGAPAPPNTEPVSESHKLLPPVFHTRVSSKIPLPRLIRPFSVACPSLPLSKCSRNQGSSSKLKRPLPDYPANFLQPHLPQHPELPSSQQMFSPQCLTSALLEVKRNYEYILSKPRDVKNKKVVVKEEQCELPLISPDEQRVEHSRMERTAYDLEIVL